MITVESKEREIKGRKEYFVAVLEKNDYTGEWETIWSAVRSHPFIVQVESGEQVVDN